MEERAVYLGQGGEVGELDPFVCLVHRQSDEAEFGDRTVGPDEPRVGGAAGGAEFGRPSGDPPDRLGKAAAEHTRCDDKRFAADPNTERVTPADLIGPLPAPALALLTRPALLG